MTHWAAHVIGKPYEAHACGPDSFDCIGLVRYYFKKRHGVELPPYGLQDPAPKLRAFAKATGWRPTSEAPQDEDLLLMDSIEGPHIGVILQINQGLVILHAVGNNQKGSVGWQHLDTLSLFGYKNFQAWRRQ